MESFVVESYSKDKKRILICCICTSGKTCECKAKLLDGIKKYDIGNPKDEYFLDYTLAKILKDVSPSWVIAIGGSIFIEGIEKSGGGVLGNPFSDISSAEDDIEIIGERLYALTFSGRFGIVFESDLGKSRVIAHIISRFICSNENIDYIVRYLTDNLSLFIFVSDGSGPNKNTYVSAKNYTELYELS